MKDLSILIPARNELFLKNTLDDMLANIEADTEIIVVLDGQWADPQIPQHERVNIIYVPEPIGQRAAANLACNLAQGKYVMKVDAHCSFDKGFDKKMIEAYASLEGWVCEDDHFNKEEGLCTHDVVDMNSDYADYNKACGKKTVWQDSNNVTMLPIMRNLWAFDWKCFHCGWKKYQGPTPKICEQCKKSDRIKRKIVWMGKRNPSSPSFSFDTEPHFKYFEGWKHREPFLTDKKERMLTETMSIQGSCFMLTREKYHELNICDEALGSWGSQGIEVACKTWLSGGRVLVNHNTWYAHLFRTQGGDFGFPYKQHQSRIELAKKAVRELFYPNLWPQQIYPLSWLIEKFKPVDDWHDESGKATLEKINLEGEKFYKNQQSTISSKKNLVA